MNGCADGAGAVRRWLNGAGSGARVVERSGEQEAEAEAEAVGRGTVEQKIAADGKRKILKVLI